MTEHIAPPLPAFHDRDCDLSIGRMVLTVAGAFAAMATGTAAAAQSTPDVEARIAAYHACPARGVSWGPAIAPRPVTAQSYDENEPDPDAESDLRAPDVWVAPPSASSRHRALRDRAGRATPERAQQVRAFRDFSHHGGQFLSSLIAQRDAAGIWRVDDIREWLAVSSGGPLPSSETQEWALSAAESEQLDALVADPCLNAEPLWSSRHDFAILGSQDQVTFEVIGQDTPVVLRRYSDGFGRSQEILEIIYRARPTKESAR